MPTIPQGHEDHKVKWQAWRVLGKRLRERSFKTCSFMHNTLFDNIERIDEGPGKYTDPVFKVLNRSARAIFAEARSILDEWFSRYPTKARSDLRGRFRSPDNRVHRAALLELYAHDLLLRHGYDVEPHPLLQNTGNHVDFLVRKGDKRLFYLEVTSVNDGDDRVKALARENLVYDALNKMRSPNFFLEIEVRAGEPHTSPPAKKLRNFLEDQLAKLDPDEIARTFAGGTPSKPVWPWSHDGWVILFKPIPKSTDIRGNDAIRPLGIRSTVQWISDDERIRDVVNGKLSRYGDLDLPFAIFLNIGGDFGFSDRSTIMEALFGKETVTLFRRPDGSRGTEVGRNYNGIWIDPRRGFRNSRLSALLTIAGLHAWNTQEKMPELWLHPRASKAFDPSWLKMPYLAHNELKGEMELFANP